MKTFNTLWLVGAAAIFAGACSRNAAPTDDGLKSDLALAAQAYNPQQFMSPTEQAPNPYNPYVPAASPVLQRAPAQAQVQRVATTQRAPAPAPARSTSSGTIYRAPAPAPAPEPRVIKNTKRDAAIGAAAGAIIGASTSRDKVKGGLIGAAIGGVIGGVIGNNVDVQRRY